MICHWINPNPSYRFYIYSQQIPWPGAVSFGGCERPAKHLFGRPLMAQRRRRTFRLKALAVAQAECDSITESIEQVVFPVAGLVAYRYYVSRALVEDRKAEAGSISRVPADQIETKVVEALRGLPIIELPEELTSEKLRSTARAKIKRVVVENGRLAIELADKPGKRHKQPTLFVEWERDSGRARREVLLPDASTDPRPIRSESRSTLVRGIAMGRLWLNELTSGKVRDADQIATSEGRTKRSVHMMLSLAFLAPDIVEAAVVGRLPRGIGMTRLNDLPPSWAHQWSLLGFGQRP